MDKDAIKVLCGFVNEVLHLICNLITLIKQELSIIIEPIEREVLDTNRRPLVFYLPPRAVNYMRDLVNGEKL